MCVLQKAVHPTVPNHFCSDVRTVPSRLGADSSPKRRRVVFHIGPTRSRRSPRSPWPIGFRTRSAAPGSSPTERRRWGVSAGRVQRQRQTGNRERPRGKTVPELAGERNRFGRLGRNTVCVGRRHGFGIEKEEQWTCFEGLTRVFFRKSPRPMSTVYAKSAK